MAIESQILTTEKAQLQWLGHALRMEPERMASRILHAKPNTRRPVGRPRTRWWDQVSGFCRRAGIDTADIQTIAEDRTEWRRLVAALQPRP